MRCCARDVTHVAAGKGCAMLLWVQCCLQLHARASILASLSRALSAALMAPDTWKVEGLSAVPYMKAAALWMGHTFASVPVSVLWVPGQDAMHGVKQVPPHCCVVTAGAETRLPCGARWRTCRHAGRPGSAAIGHR